MSNSTPQGPGPQYGSEESGPLDDVDAGPDTEPEDVIDIAKNEGPELTAGDS